MRTAVSHPDRTPRDASGTTISTTLVAACLVLALTACITYTVNGHGQTAHAASDERTPVKTNQAVAMPQPPPDITWELVSGETVPVSLSAGPTKTDGPVRYGFAHTPTGAAFAAINIAIRYAFTAGNGWMQVTQRQVEPSIGRDVYIAARRNLTDMDPPDGGYGQLAGYRLLNYGPTSARIELAEVFASGSKQTSELTMVWRNNDWLLALRPDGGTGPQQVLDDNSSDFVALSARMFP